MDCFNAWRPAPRAHKRQGDRAQTQPAAFADACVGHGGLRLMHMFMCMSPRAGSTLVGPPVDVRDHVWPGRKVHLRQEH
jgi:hypothetical protein